MNSGVQRYIVIFEDPQNVDVGKLNFIIKTDRMVSLMKFHCYTYNQTQWSTNFNCTFDLYSLAGGASKIVFISFKSLTSNRNKSFIYIQNFKKLRHYCAGQQPIPIQEVATALWNDDEHSKINREIYIKKFNLAKEIFKNFKDFYLPDGGFYLWLKVGNGEKITKLKSSKALTFLHISYYQD